MWFVEWIISIITFPVNWFWEKAYIYRKEGRKGSIILLFALSLSGLLLFTFAFIWGSVWLWTNHNEIVIGLGLVIWLYSYVHSKNEKAKKQIDEEKQVVNQAESELREQAKYDYPRIKTIIYRTLKGSADSIGGKTPVSENEIVITESPYMIANGVIFYQFQMTKHNMNMRYEKAELEEYARVLQEDIARKIRTGDFPDIPSDKIWHDDGKTYDIITIDGIEDMGNCFFIRVVRFSPKYVEYRRMLDERQMIGMTGAQELPTAKWEEL